jgi:uncharacterized protein YdaU (DUF1376 family)
MKDPAFLFYSDNFLSGTMFFTDEQVGKYIRLLCAQHLTGHLKENHMIFICKSHDNDIWSKFKKDDAGLYYNERLEMEILRRQKYSESRSNNKKGKVKQPKTKPKKTSKSYDDHMGNENETEICNLNMNNFSSEFLKEWDILIRMKKWKDKPKESLSKTLDKLSKYESEFAIELVNNAISGNYQGIIFPDTDEKYEKWKLNKHLPSSQQKQKKLSY